MSILSKVSFIFFTLSGGIFFLSSFLVLKGSTHSYIILASNTFDLPFFVFAVMLLFSGIADVLKKYKKNSHFFHFLLAFFAALLILALIYINIGVLDK